MQTRRLERLLRLLQALHSQGWSTVDELASAAGVSRRTVFRDLRLLERAGIPYRYDRDSRRYCAEKTSLLPPVAVSHAEALALLMAVRTMLDKPFVADLEAARTAAAKLQSMLPATVVDYCGRLLRHREIRAWKASDPAVVTGILPQLQHALAARKKVRVRYDSVFEGRVIETTLRLYAVLYQHRAWYVLAYSERDGRVLTFKIERFLSLRFLPDSYRLDPGFSVDDHFGNAWNMIKGDRRHHVRIRFSRKVATTVDEVVWHKTQRTEYLGDGSLLFEVDVDGVDEISWWVLGYGDQAEVLEPPELRALILEHVRRMSATYTGSG